MQVSFRNGSVLVLAVTALACSRTMLALIDDPEGPNLLVVTVLAAVIYVPSLAAYMSRVYPSLTGFRRTAAAILIQIAFATVLYLGLR